MKNTVIIAEKPSVAQKIAYALKPEFSSFTKKVYKKVTYYELKNDEKTIHISPAVGHLFTLKEKSTELPIFNLEWVPTHQVNKSAWYIKDYMDNLQNLIKNADLIINATDFDIEGSLIGYNIIRNYGDIRKAKRMKFSTITPSELRESFHNLIDFDINNAYAGEVRHIIDWFYGINLSRAVMNAIRKAGRFKVLSIGRVQGPMLYFLFKKEEEIESFKPELYWQVIIDLENISFSHINNPFKNKNEAEKAKKNTSDTGKITIISSMRKIYALPPFDFTSLQTEAYRIYGYIPVKTQEIAQSLYEKALISYPRTSSQKLPYQINVRNIIENLSQNPTFSHLANQLITENKFRPREGKKEDVHPAIYPTGNKEKLNPDEEKLYNLIVYRFLACFADPVEIKDNKLILNAKETYESSISEIVKQGWYIFYPFNNEKESKLTFKDGQEVRIDKVIINEKTTTPPQRYTPASILQLMEKENIGTKTTRALVLDTLYKRGYVTGKQLNITPLGKAIYQTFSHYSPKILDPNLTRQLEEEMEKIRNKEVEKEKVINDAKEIITSVINDILSNDKEIGNFLRQQLEESEKFAPCKCGGYMKVVNYKDKKFLGCSNYPNCKTTFSLPPTYLFTYAGTCDICTSPKIWIIKGKQRYQKCLNQYCSSNKKVETDEKKSKKTIKKLKQSNKK